MLAKLILAVTLAASAFLGNGGPLCHEQSATFDGFYLRVDSVGQPSLWQETNGQPCLQTSAQVVGGGPFRVELPPDERILL